MNYEDDLDRPDDRALEPAEAGPLNEAGLSGNETQAPDLTKVQTMILSDDWVNAEPEQRKAMAGKAFDLIVNAVSSNPTKVPNVVRQDGTQTVEDVDALNKFGNLNRAGRSYLDKAFQVLNAAASDPDGGVVYNELTQSVEPASWVNEAMQKEANKREGAPVASDVESWFKEQVASGQDVPKGSTAYKSFREYLKAKPGASEDLDEDQFKEELERASFDPGQMPDDQIIAMVGGAPVINPKNISEINKVEAAIQNIPGFSDAQKKLMLADYHNTVEDNMGEIVNAFSSADAGVIMGIGSSPLRDEFEAAMVNGESGVDFLRKNAARMSKDSYDSPGAIKETIAKLRDAVMQTGTGALWLAGNTIGRGIDTVTGGDSARNLLETPARAWGWLSETHSGAFANPVVGEIPFTDIEVNQRDLTELGGQIGSFLVMGGLGKMGTGFLGLGTAKAAMAEGLTSAEGAIASSLGRKTLNFLKAAATDTTAYLGGLQAAGMSYGRTYKLTMDATGDEKSAQRAATIAATSDGLSATIATAVMGRVAPGMERLLGASEGALSGSVIQRIRAATAGRAGMEAVKDSLKNFTPELRKQFVKDLTKTMTKQAGAAGLRGLGLGAEVIAEGVEETLDEALSDVIEVVIDDSKDWSEQDWGKIHNNFEGYIKAGFLGALGGLGGGAPHAAQSGIQALGKDTQRKAYIKAAVADQWKLIKANVEQFANHDMMVNTTKYGAVNVAEFIASPNYSIQEKSDIMQKAARFGETDLLATTEDVADQTVSPAKSLPELTEEQEFDEEGNPTVFQKNGKQEPGFVPPDTAQGERAAILKAMGHELPPGREWKKLSIEEGKPIKLGRDQTFTPLTINGVANAGAKFQALDNLTGEVTSERFVNSQEAEQLLPQGHSQRALFNQKNQEQSLDGSSDVESWTQPIPEPAPESKTEAKPVTTAKPAAKAEAKPAPKPEVKAEAAPAPVEETKPAPKLKTGPVDTAERSAWVESAKDLVEDEGSDRFDEEEYPARAGLSQYAKDYSGDEDVWMDKRDGRVRVSPSFVEKVMADESIEDKDKAIAERVLALQTGKAIKLQAAAAPSTEPTSRTNFIVPEQRLTSGEADKQGGKWRADKGTYYYTPAKGKTMAIGAGEVVSIGGSETEKLVLVDVQNGEFVFRRVDVSDFNIDPDTQTRVNKVNADWNKNRLLKSAVAIDPVLDSIFGDMPDIKGFRKAFETVLREVAPDAATPNYTTIDDGFMHASLTTNEDGKQELVMEVDLAKTAETLKKLIGDANLSNARVRMLAGFEASRLLAKYIEEEQVHLLTMNSEKFSPDELRKLYREAASDEKHPFHELLKQTVEERFPGASMELNARNPDSLSRRENGVYIVASEFLRKLHQIRTGGYTTEQANRDAVTLTRAMNTDAAQAKGWVKTIGEMLRRYTQRIRSVLHMRWLQGRLQGTSKILLDRLNVEATNANIRGDVDLVREKTSASAETRLKTFTEAMEDEVGKIARKHSNALMQLRSIPNEFKAVRLDDILTVNDDMELGLRDHVKEFLADSPKYDLPAIEEALADLNAEESYQRAWSQAFMARQLMESREAELEFNPTEFFNWMEGREFDPRGVMSFIVAGAPRTDRNGMATVDPLVVAARNHAAALDDEMDRFHRDFIVDDLRRIQSLNSGSSVDRAKLIKRATDLGLPVESILAGENYDDLRNRVASATEARLSDDEFFHQYLNPNQKEYLRELQQKRVSASERIKELTAILTTDEKEIANFNEKMKDLLTSPANLNYKQQRIRTEAGTDMELAKQRYDKFTEYLRALDSYNYQIQNLKARAIGSFEYETEGYGLNFVDQRVGRQVGKEKIDPLSPANSAAEVFGHNYRRADHGRGVVPGDSYPRNPDVNDDEKTAEFLRAHKRAVESNAAFLGRQARLDYYLADSLQKLPGSFPKDLYSAGAGFNFRFFENEHGRAVYESEDEAFPRFDGMDDLFAVSKRFEDVIGSGEKLDTTMGALVSYIGKARKWVERLRETTDPERIVAEMAKTQSPAARANMLLEPRIEEFVNTLDILEASFVGHTAGKLDYNPELPFDQAFARNPDGSFVTFGPSDNIYREFVQAMAPGSRSSTVAYMREAQLALNSAVNLTRRMVREFNNEQWQRNLEREANRTIRDAAYKPDHVQMEELRDTRLDLIVMRNLDFGLEYFTKYPDSQYWVGPVWATELLESHRKVERGSPQTTVAPNVKTVVGEDGKPRSVITPADGDTLIVSSNDIGTDGRPSMRGTTLDDALEALATDASTAAEQAARAEDQVNQQVRKWITTALTFIGFRANTWNGHINDAREFRRAVINHALTGEGNVSSLIETALRGMFKNIPPGEKFEALVSDFYDKNKRWMVRENEAVRNFDPEAFVMDLLEYKAGFERDALAQARVEAGDQVSVVGKLIADSKLPQDEKEGLARILSKGDKVAIYDAQKLEGSDIWLTNNPALSLLMQSMPGSTLIVQPSDRQSYIADAQVGLRVIPGETNVIIAPQQVSTRSDEAAALEAVLSSYGSKPEARAQVEGLADIIRNTLFPAFNAQKAVWDVDAQLGAHKRLRKQVALRERVEGDAKLRKALAKQLKMIRKDERAKFIELAADHVIRLSQALEGATAADFAKGYGSDVALVTKVLTDPQWKRAFDLGYIGTDENAEFNLPENILDALDASLVRMRGVFVEDNYYEDSIADELPEVADDESEEDQDQIGAIGNENAALLDKLQRELAKDVADEAEMEDEEVSDLPENLEASPVMLQKFLNPQRMTSDNPYQEVIPPSDSVLFNTLAGLLISTRGDQVEAPGVEAQSDRDLLEQAGGLSNAAPIINERGRSTWSRNRVRYVGSALHLPMKRGNGHTALKGQMDAFRRGTEQAALLSRLSPVNQLVATGLSRAVRRFNNEKLDFVPQVGVEQVADDRLIEQLAASLPDIVRHKAELEAVLAGRQAMRDELLGRISEAQNVLLNQAPVETSVLDWADFKSVELVNQVADRLVGAARGLDMGINFDAKAAQGLVEASRTLSDLQVRNLVDRAFQMVEERGTSHSAFEALNELAVGTQEGQRLLRNAAETGEQRQAREQAEWTIKESYRHLDRLSQNDALTFHMEPDHVGRYVEPTDIRKGDGTPVSARVQIDLIPDQGQTPEQYWVNREAVKRALGDVAATRIDDMYKKLRGQLDQFQTFNPAELINEAIRRVAVEDSILADRMKEASDVATAAEQRGLTADAVAYLTDANTIASVKMQNRIKRLQLPENHAERRKVIGQMFDDGQPIALVYENAKERLLKAFPGRLSPRTINQHMADVTLKALGQVIPAANTTPPVTIFDLGEVGLPFKSDDFSLTNGQKLDGEAAGKLFAAKFRKDLKTYLNRGRKNGIDFAGENTKKSVELFESLIEKLTHAYGDSIIEKNPDLSAELKGFLTAISDGTFIESDQAMQGFDPIGTFARVYAEREANVIMDKLVMGLHIQDGKLHQGLLKYAHHQDARIRSRFIKNHVAQQTAIHLQSFLERGFDGETGRNGHQVNYKEAQDAIARAAKELGTSGMDHTIGYMLAQLDGLQDAQGLTLTQSLGQWYKATSDGIKDLRSLNRAQRARWGRIGRYFNANHIDLIRDLPMVDEIVKTLRDSKAMDGFGAIDQARVNDANAADEAAAEIIQKLKTALLSKTEKKAEAQAYADKVRSTLKDAYHATAVTRALLSKPHKQPQPGEKWDEWTHGEVTPVKPTYSSVPVRLAYAANPATNLQNLPREGRWVPDPNDVLSINESPFYGGHGRHEANPNNAGVMRPINMNGLSAPLGIIEDSIYRTNVAPNYQVLRHLLGRVETRSGVPYVADALFMPKKFRRMAEWQEVGRSWQVATAAVASEIENNVFNDSQIGVTNTAFAQTAQFLASVYVVRALASATQLIYQTIPPITFFITKKLLTKQYQEAGDFVKIISKYMGSLVSNPGSIFGEHRNRDEFHHKVAQFTKEVSPFVHFRGLDGQDMARDELKHQLRYNTSPLQAWAGKIARGYQNVGEKAMDISIGAGERVVARSIFLSELMSELRKTGVANAPVTAEELIEKWDSGTIPVVANEMARIKTSDMMGQSDTSKKSFMFQSHSENPGWSALIKSLVRFSNHTATTSSNLVAFLPGLNSSDQKVRQEAWENAVGTLGQNIMFQFLKVHTMVPLVAMAFYMLGGNDDDKAMRKAQKLADSMLDLNEKKHPFGSFVQQALIGPDRQLFQDWKTTKASKGSAMAELGSKVAMEFGQAVPVLGVLAGYSPVTSTVKPAVLDPAAQEIAAFLVGTHAAEAWYEKDGVGIRQNQPNAVETIANVTAPTSVLYDAADAGLISMQAVGDSKPLDIAAYLASEVIPFLRDYRMARRKQLESDLQKNKPKKARGK